MSGRPKINPKDKVEKICGYIRVGNDKKSSAILSGISERLFYEWQQQGLEDEKNGENTVYLQFVRSVRHAEEDYCRSLVEVVTNSAQDGDVKTAQWMLEKKKPGEYGSKQTLVHEGGLNVVSFDIKLTEEEKKAYHERLANLFECAPKDKIKELEEGDKK